MPRGGGALVVLALALLVCPALTAQDGVTLSGRVLDAGSGEPIAKARVSIRGHGEALTDAGGRFVLIGVPPGEAALDVSVVGYGRRRKVVFAGADTGEIEIRVDQEALRRSEEVAVVAASSEPADPAAPAAHVVAGTDLKNLASVLVDDPLRSVQSLPGVAAGDDFGATFAARGLGFASVGFYVDGVLMTSPFHTVRDVNDGFSLTVLNGDVVDSLSLITGAAPARYGDRTGTVLAVTTREGSREGLAGRVSLGATGLYATFEGPLGESRRTSWLLSARKSYLGYVLERLDRGGMGLGFYDATGRLSHHPSPSQTVSLRVLHGRSRWTSAEAGLRPQDTHTADAGTDLGTLQWRWTPSARSWIESVAFFSRESGRNRNLDATDRLFSVADQWGLRTDATRVFGSHRVEAGLLLRGLSEDAVARTYERRPASYRVTVNDTARTAEEGAYLQETWTAASGRLHLTAGGRVDHFGETGETRMTPRASLDWRASGATRVIAAVGQYAQFPDFQQLLGRNASPDLRAERATHSLLGVERRLGTSTSVRVEAYDQRLDGFITNPEADWRRVGKRMIGPRSDAPLQNSLSGESRGIEMTVQRRSANGLSGWVAYTLGRARWRDDSGPSFDGDFDQRHTLTVFGSWRVGPTVNLSTKYRYGSGLPVPGFYEGNADGVFLSSRRNLYRPEAYSRWDLRATRTFAFARWRLTLYGEVLNVLGRTQTRYTGFDGVDLGTGRVSFESDTLFPRLPSAGVTVEF